eukprot:7941033-Lingulodinium_polyedra.AAC.1
MSSSNKTTKITDIVPSQPLGAHIGWVAGIHDLGKCKKLLRANLLDIEIRTIYTSAIAEPLPVDDTQRGRRVGLRCSSNLDAPILHHTSLLGPRRNT